MIYLVSADQLKSAIELARKSDLFVRPTSLSRQYLVTDRGDGHQYYVDFFVRDGKRYGHCQCTAGVRHIACGHLVAALSLHLGLSALRRRLKVVR